MTALYGLGPNDGQLVRQRYAAIDATFAYDPDLLSRAPDFSERACSS